MTNSFANPLSPSGPSFRRAQLSDDPAIRRILEESHLSYRVSYRASEPRLSASVPGASTGEGNFQFACHVCELGGQVVGVLQWRKLDFEAEIHDVAVMLAKRRNGLATFLLQSFLQLARADGIRRIFLEVRESNAGAIRLYESVGFRTTGRRPAYYRNPTEAAELMTISIAD